MFQLFLLQDTSRKGIIWIVAHGSGYLIRLSTGKLIQVTPADIESLHFQHSPFVVVRVCDGGENAFPAAFLKAGAKGVWINKGKIYAPDVNREINDFVENLSGSTLYEAVQKTNAVKSDRKYSNGLTVELRLITPYSRPMRKVQCVNAMTTENEIIQLLGATDAELFAVLGAQALPLVEGPSEFLDLGRKGKFSVSGSMPLGAAPEFDHRPLEFIGKKFLRLWKVQIRVAVCGDSPLSKEIARHGPVEIPANLIGIAIGSLSASIPGLTPFSGLLYIYKVGRHSSVYSYSDREE